MGACKHTFHINISMTTTSTKQTTTTTTKLLWTNRLSSHLPTPCRLIQLLDYHHHLPNINFAPSITCKLTRVSLTGPTQYQNSLIITFTIKNCNLFWVACTSDRQVCTCTTSVRVCVPWLVSVT